MVHLQEIIVTGQWFHEINGKRYYPLDPLTTLDAYRANVAAAYGSLRGIKIGYDRAKIATILNRTEYDA